jgi:hypothetical protein
MVGADIDKQASSSSLTKDPSQQHVFAFLRVGPYGVNAGVDPQPLAQKRQVLVEKLRELLANAGGISGVTSSAMGKHLFR